MKQFFLTTFLLICVQFSFAQCAGFQIVADKSEICAPDIVRFQVLNPVPGSTYEWNVGNGIVFGADTLFSFYTVPGVKNATVRITLPNGTVCNVTENAILTVNNVPVPQFSSSDIILCEGPDSVILTDITPNSASRSWVIDGTNYGNSGNEIRHGFVTSGEKRVSLVVVDSNGCQGVSEFMDTIKVYDDPNFSFTSNSTSGCIPVSVNLSLDNDPNIAPFTKSYLWTFNDDPTNTSTIANPATQIYNTEGEYSVKLEITISNGCTYEIDEQAYIQVGDTVPLGLVSGNVNPCKNDILNFYQSNDTLSGNVSWTFAGLANQVLSRTNDSASILASTSGNLNVILLYNQNGCVTRREFLNFVNIQGVEANFSSDNRYDCDVPHTVDLINSSDTLDATALDYSWRILDGNTALFTSSQENPSFTFNVMPAEYDVELAVLGDNGCTDTLIRSGYIYQDSLDLEFAVLPEKGCIGQQINFSNNTRRSTYVAPDEFKWYFLDKDGVNFLDSSVLSEPSLSYSDTGFYDILLIGFNSRGCTDTLLVEDAVEIINTDLQYSIADTIFCAATQVALTGSSLPLDAEFNYTWTFRNLTNPSTPYIYTGASATARLFQIGKYEAIVTQDIAGGCMTSDTFYVHSNGVQANIILDTSFGCAPLDVKPSIEIIADKFEGQADSAYSFQWSVIPNSGILSENVLTDTPSFSFTENGDYTIALRLENSAGCVFRGNSQKILTGVRAGISLADNRICFGDSIYAFDESNNGVTDITWTMTPDVVHTLINTDSNLYKIAIESPGSYYLEQVVTNSGICYDTARVAFEILKVQADFEAVDSFLRCAPIYAEFQSRSSNADTLIWYFGTGDTFKTTNTNAGFIYQRNSGWGEGYDISLIAKNVEGCTDTTIKEDYLIVAGPTPLFEMQNYVGCEPLQVSFTDQSTDGSSFFLNYNDGSQLDSTKTGNNIGIHTYTVQGVNDLRQTIMPSIIVYDSIGCAAVFEPADSIVLFRKPVAAIQLPTSSEGCSPFNLVFSDTSKFTNTRTWWYKDAQISSLEFDSLSEAEVGSHELTLIARNSNSCIDTSSANFGVFETPAVSFSIEDTICIRRVTRFTGEVTSSNPNNYFRWNFGEAGTIGNNENSNLNPAFTYANGGVKTVTLFAGLNNGCGDSVQQDIIITDESSIDNPQIDVVTFDENYEVSITYQESSIPKFRKYILNTPTGDQEIYDRADTEYFQDLVVEPTAAPCYTLTVGDYCDLEGDASTTHCAMLLSVSSTVAYQNDLVWTPYIGWGGVDEYQIYRENEDGVFMKIGEVDGNTTSYSDLSLCNEEYFYYVQAIHPSNGLTSRTYNVSQTPIYILNTISSSIEVVSVESEREISIEWSESQFSEFDTYEITKYAGDKSNEIDVFYTRDTFMLDGDVNTDEMSYIYEVKEIDRCGYESSAAREGKSILLTGKYVDGSYLNWTEYQNWAAGVREYNLEIDKANGFEQRDKIAGNTTNYVDRRYYRDITGEYCYRVYAVSNERDTSYSNVICLSGEPKVDLPSAFSPNGDNLNDKFNPISQFILQGELEEINSFYFEVYNRWGERIYSTDNAMEGWDGSYKGADCQQGAYIYLLKAKGLNGRVITHEGTITLLR